MRIERGSRFSVMAVGADGLADAAGLVMSAVAGQRVSGGG
jgi:hypothetical protein